MNEINLIPKEYKKRRLGLGNTFSKTGGIVLILLILSLLVYGGLLFYKNKIKTKLENINQEITNLEAKRNTSEELAIYYADKKLNLVQELFKNHAYWSQIFDKIQELAVPQVYFSDFKSMFLDGRLEIALTGRTVSYTVLAKQMTAFKEDAMVATINLSKIALSESGGIDFDFLIVFKNDILIKTATAE